MKSFIIIIPLIGIHSMYDLTTLSAEDGVEEYLLNIIATPFCAPMFMFCMGVTLCFSRHQEPMDYLRRGIKLITIGMMLNVLHYLPTAYSAAMAGEGNIYCGWAQIFNVDILQFAGLAFILLALLKKLNLNHWLILAIALILNVIGTLLDGCNTDSYAINQFLGYFYPTPTCCCFPLMNWFIFVAAGNVMGWLYQNGNTEKFLRVAFPIGLIFTIMYMYLCLVAEAPFIRALQNDWGYYSMHTLDALFTTFAIAPFMLGFFRLLSKAIPKKWENALCYPSLHINQYYCVSWVLIMWIANLFLFIPKATTEVGLLFAWLMIVVLTTISVIIYNRYLKVGMNTFFGRHTIAWTIGIWVVLILFGAWYFTTIPEPYIMPY